MRELDPALPRFFDRVIRLVKGATMSSGQSSIPEPDRASKAAWRNIVEKCQQPSAGRAFWQLVNTLVPYALLWYLMYRTL